MRARQFSTTNQDKLQPTPDQEQPLETALFRLRRLYGCARERRKTWRQR